ncbi:toprim domain-containing protein, partial [Candidatus Woesearchaeota archaeon]|nr:toprim domain-containing protein [Candidatus Woesearchaeota archaeon]
QDILRDNDVGFDRDRRRITFGLRDHHGNLAGVSGRTVIDEEPRYKIYRAEFKSIAPGYELDKSRILWGLDKFYHSRLHVGSEGPVVVCEGFKAALWVKQAGHEDVVAVIGSSVSHAQHVLLSRVATEVVLFFDNDTAGVKAAWKFSRILGDMDVKVANYGTSQPISPDDLTPERVRVAIETALPASVWRKTNAKLGRVPETTERPARQIHG